MQQPAGSGRADLRRWQGIVSARGAGDVRGTWIAPVVSAWECVDVRLPRGRLAALHSAPPPAARPRPGRAAAVEVET